MSAARAAILDRVRSGQRTGRIPAAARASFDRLRTSADWPPLAPSSPKGERRNLCLDRFVAELAALGVECHVETSAGAVQARVAEIVGGRSVLAWDADRLPYDVADILAGASTGSSARDAQAAAEIGVTGCDAAIAETGSLVLLSGEGKPRTASLLPPVHLAIVRRADLRFTVGEFFGERAGDLANAACCALVTGPSRTADIELTLTLGVHGPGRLVVILGP